MSTEKTDAQLRAELQDWEAAKAQVRRQGRAVSFGDRSRTNLTLDEINEEINAIETTLIHRERARAGGSYIGLSGRFISID